MKKILVAVHEMSYTGVPQAVKRMCEVLVKNQFQIEVWSWKDGEYATEFSTLGIKLFIINCNEIHNPSYKKKIKAFDLIIANTICTHEIVQLYQETIPVIWYIHEASSLNQLWRYEKERYSTLMRASNVYVVSGYAKRYLSNIYKGKIKILHNYIEDVYDNYSEKNANREKIKFLLLGAIIPEKGYTHFISAYTNMHNTYQKKCRLYIAGKKYDSLFCDKVFEKIRDYEDICYCGELTTREEIFHLISDVDVVVVVSKDESCSLVALEAAMMKKPIIINKNIGARYIVNSKNGWIVDMQKPFGLQEIYQYIIDHPEELSKMGENARKEYLHTSTLEIYEKNILKEINYQLCISKKFFIIKNLPRKFINLFLRKIVDSPFWFSDIKRNSKIIIYGAGTEGNRFYYKLKRMNYCEIVLWVDQNHKNYDERIDDPNRILYAKYDFILIAIIEKKFMIQVKEFLHYNNVPESKIKWIMDIE